MALAVLLLRRNAVVMICNLKCFHFHFCTKFVKCSDLCFFFFEIVILRFWKNHEQFQFKCTLSSLFCLSFWNYAWSQKILLRLCLFTFIYRGSSDDVTPAHFLKKSFFMHLNRSWLFERPLLNWRNSNFLWPLSLLGSLSPLFALHHLWNKNCFAFWQAQWNSQTCQSIKKHFKWSTLIFPQGCTPLISPSLSPPSLFVCVSGSNSWQVVSSGGAVVQGGYGHSSVYDEASGCVFVHGGYKALNNNKYGLVDHMYRYHVHTRTWWEHINSTMDFF